MAESKEHSEIVVVRLDAKQSEVNATAVASSMSAVIALIEEAQEGIADNQQLLVKARPFAEGSFEIPLDLIAVATAALFDNSHLIDQVLDTLKRYFDVKAALKGKRAPRDENAVFTIEGNDITIGNITLNMLQPSSHASRELDRAMQHIERDETIEGLEILRGKSRKQLVKVPRSEIGSYRIRDAQEEMAAERDLRSRETLYIVALVFEGRAYWKFNRSGHIISARITDTLFTDRVSRGDASFAAGDTLEVDLVVHQTLDEATNAYLNKTFIVEHVRNHEKRMGQSSLLDE